MSRIHRASGFTLVELLIVVAIIGLLIQIALPAIESSREAARRTACADHLRQIGLAILSYESAHEVLPPGCTVKPKEHNFVQFLLPYMEESAIHELYDFDYHWHELQNKRAVENEIPLLHCPSGSRKYPYVCDYGVFERLNPTLEKEMVDQGFIKDRDSRGALRREPRRAAKIIDGLSKTVFLCETSGRPDKYELGKLISKGRIDGSEWASADNRFDVHHHCGGGVMGEGPQLMNCNNANEIYSFHMEGCNFLFGDASVRFVMEDIDPEVLVSMLTARGKD